MLGEEVMKKILAVKVCLLGVLMVVLTGCSFQQLSSDHNFGSVPTDYKDKIVAYYQMVLKDPESAKYRFGTPYTAYTNIGTAAGGEVSWSGWAVDVQINAKNSYGGYTGFETERVLFKNNTVYKLPYGYAKFTRVN